MDCQERLCRNLLLDPIEFIANYKRNLNQAKLILNIQLPDKAKIKRKQKCKEDIYHLVKLMNSRILEENNLLIVEKI
jgi:hypothetical protein